MKRLVKLGPWALSALLASTAWAEPIEVVGRVEGVIAGSETRVLLEPAVPVAVCLARWLEGREAPVLATAPVAADGSYRLAVPGAGMYRLVVESEGSLPVRLLVAISAEAEVPAARLQEARPFEVVVREPDGRPASGVVVRVGFELLTPSEVWPTTDPGRWRPRTRLARTDRDGRAVLPRGADEEWLDVYAPGEHLQVRERDRASIVLPERRGFSLHVEDDDGPVAGVVALGSGAPLAATGADGALQVDAEPGAQLTLLARDGRFERVELPPGDGGRVEKHLSPLETITGRVLAADGERPVPGAWVWYQSPQATATDGSGAFVLTLSPWPGDRELVFLTAAAPGYLPALERVPLKGSEAILRLRRAAELSGRVLNGVGSPLSDVQVEAVPRDRETAPRWRRSVTTRSGPDGDFRLRTLTAGSAYVLVASADGVAPAVDTARAGSTDPVTLVLAPGASVTGRAVAEDGRPVRCAELVLTPTEGETPAQSYLFRELRVLRRASSGPDGRFRLTDVPAGRWNLMAKSPRHLPALRLDLLVERGTVELDLGDVRFERVWRPASGSAPAGEPCGKEGGQVSEPGDRSGPAL